MQIEELTKLRPTIEPHIGHIIDAARRWADHGKQIERVQNDIQKGMIEKVESEERLTKFKARELEIATIQGRLPDTQTEGAAASVRRFGLERMLGGVSNFLSVEFFEAGLSAARPVGRIQTPLSVGTGFLVGNDILLTNNHVLADEDMAGNSVFELDAEENRYGAPKILRTFQLAPDRFFATHKKLDFTFVAVEPTAEDGAPIADFGCHPLIVGEGKIRIGDSINLVQHPAGGPKSVVVHNSKLIFLDNDLKIDEFCFYTSDTDEGSSGCPVFNNHWEVIALHHASVPKMNSAGDLIDRSGHVLSVERARDNPQEIVWIANEGIRISRLVRGFEALKLSNEFAAVRDELLERWKTPKRPIDAFHEARHLPRANGGSVEHAVSVGGREVMIPINVVVQIGEAALRNRET